MIKRPPSFLRRRRRRAGPGVERRSYGNASGWLTARTQAGVEVTPDTALNFSAVYAAIGIISGDLASLPCQTLAVTPDGGKRPNLDDPLYETLYHEPNGEIDSWHFFAALWLHFLTRGNGYAEITRYKAGKLKGQPAGLHLIDPEQIEPFRDEDRRLWYKTREGQKIPPADILHLRGMTLDGILGICPVTRARQAIGLGLATEAYGASYFGNGAQTSGFLKSSKNLTKEARDNLREEYNADHMGPYQAHKVGVLVGDWEWVETSLNPQDSQFLMTREFQIVEIARWFNINPIKLMDYTHGNYSNIETANLDYATTTLLPHLTNWERELNRKLIPREQRRSRLIKHDLTSRLRGDSAARMNFYKGGFGIGILSQNDIRRMEDMNPVPDGDRYYIPGNNMVATGSPEAADPAAEREDKSHWVKPPRPRPTAAALADAALEATGGVFR
jgi:HK97 family phage portal protein